MRWHKVQDIGAALFEFAQIRSFRIERNMAHVAAARLVNARKAKIARILDGVGLLAAQKLHQHGIEQLCTGANHDSLGVNIHSARSAQMRRNRAAQTGRSLRRRWRKQFALALARKHSLERTLPKAGAIERRFWQVGYRHKSTAGRNAPGIAIRRILEPGHSCRPR